MERYWSGDRGGIACALAMGDGICGDAHERSEPRGLCGQAQKRGKKAWKDIEGGGARGQIKLYWFHGKLRCGMSGQRVVLSGQPRAGRIFDGQLGLDVAKATLAVACGTSEYL